MKPIKNYCLGRALRYYPSRLPGSRRASLWGTIYVRFNVAYGAPAPREGVQPEEGGTLQGWGYIRVLPARGYRH